MTTNAKIKNDTQHLNIGSPYVDLYDIDASSFITTGTNTFHITPMTSAGNKILFNGVTYEPMPIEAEGFEHEGDGRMARPLVRLSNINLTFVSLIVTYNDLVGAKVTRRRTFQKYLDSGIEPDSNAQFPADIFYIERKTRHNKELIEWELKSAVDIEGLLIPKGQALDICSHRYRIWDGVSAFDYTNATCPYTDAVYFDEEGNSSTAANDKCAKKLFDCKLRFGTDQLPMRAFPGVGGLGAPYR